MIKGILGTLSSCIWLMLKIREKVFISQPSFLQSIYTQNIIFPLQSHLNSLVNYLSQVILTITPKGRTRGIYKVPNQYEGPSYLS